MPEREILKYLEKLLKFLLKVETLQGKAKVPVSIEKSKKATKNII